MKQSLEQMYAGDETATFTEWKRRDRALSKQWHLSSTQLGIALAVSGAFWLIVGIAVTARILLAWGCVGTWR